MSTHDQDKSAQARTPVPGVAAPAPAGQTGSPTQAVAPRAGPAQPHPAQSAPPRVPLRANAPPPDRRASPGAAPPAAAPGAASSPAAPPAPAEPDPPLSLVEDPPPKNLALEDTAALRKRGMAVSANPITGYNPYDTGPAAGSHPAKEGAVAPAKRTDLRKLSEWIRVQRKVEVLKKSDGDEGGK